MHPLIPPEGGLVKFVIVSSVITKIACFLLMSYLYLSGKEFLQALLIWGIVSVIVYIGTIFYTKLKGK